LSPNHAIVAAPDGASATSVPRPKIHPTSLVGGQFSGEDGVTGVLGFGGRFCEVRLARKVEVEVIGSWLPLSKPKKKKIEMIVTGPSHSVTDTCRL